MNSSAVIHLEKDLKNLKNISYESIDKLMRKIMKTYNLTAKELHNDFVKKHNKTPDDWIKDLKEGTLHHWFKGSRSKEGKPGWVNVVTGGTCASDEPGEGTPKCVSSSKRASMSKAERLSASKRKKSADPEQQEKSGAAKPTYVSTDKDKKMNEEKDKPSKGSGKKDACYSKVRSRYDVWPSAYASGALVKCRKVGASNWGTKSEDCWDGYKLKKKGKKIVPNCVPVGEETGHNALPDWYGPISEGEKRYCPKCKKDETQSECKYGPKFWAMYSSPSMLTTNQMKYDIAQIHPANEEKQPDHEHSMARSELSTIVSAAKRLRKKLNGEGNIEAWVQSKITRAADYLDAAADYIDSGEHDVHGSMDEKSEIKTFENFMQEALDKSKMKCNSPKSDPVGDSLTGKSHVVKACEGGKEKIIRFGQRGVKGSPKKKGESEAYANRRKRFQTRHAKNIAKGKMSAAYWADKVKW